MAYPVDFTPAGLTLKQLAEKHGVSVRTISNWKREWNQLTDDTLVTLAGTVDLKVIQKTTLVMLPNSSS